MKWLTDDEFFGTGLDMAAIAIALPSV